MGKEIWKEIKGFEGYYEISNLGNVKSLNYRCTQKEGLLKPCKSGKSGNLYLMVSLNVEGERTTYLIHRLVGQAFLGLKIEDRNMCVCHKDDNPQNNHRDNLFLGTQKDNLQDMVKKGRHHRTGKFYGNNLTSKKIIQYELNGNKIKQWSSIKEAQDILNISNISSVCSGRLKTSGGFIWKYKTND